MDSLTIITKNYQFVPSLPLKQAINLVILTILSAFRIAHLKYDLQMR